MLVLIETWFSGNYNIVDTYKGCVNVKWSNSSMAEESRKTYNVCEVNENTTVLELVNGIGNKYTAKIRKHHTGKMIAYNYQKA